MGPLESSPAVATRAIGGLRVFQPFRITTVKLPTRIRQASRAGLPDTPLLPLALATARPRWHTRERKCCADAP